ncbi:galactinol synthase 10-like [Chenopodium quinoa]|uniref:galactinol synthase 10-like n=1 Tax=Chenopodium quinoa TaxID=63459 RepID=UPI000B789061|nr:galactinol synthase 10-like [Chenopodium quinoa]
MLQITINRGSICYMQFVEYEKMIFIDAVQVNENIDHLFDLPNGYFYSVLDCFCDPSWGMTPQFKIGYCQHSPEKVEWPTSELGPPPPLYFNSGFFVFEPNVLTYLDMLNTFQETPPTCFAEQGQVQTTTKRVQHGDAHVVVASRQGGVEQGEGDALLRNWVEAMEVHREGSKHGQRRRKNAGEQMVGYV